MSPLVAIGFVFVAAFSSKQRDAATRYISRLAAGVEANLGAPSLKQYELTIRPVLAALAVLAAALCWANVSSHRFEAANIVLVLFMAAVLYRLWSLERLLLDSLEKLPIPLSLAGGEGLAWQLNRVTTALRDLAKQPDPLHRDLALGKLDAIASEIEGLSRGRIVFTATETWHTAYQNLLQTLKVRSYYSVAWVRSHEYWNDPPAQRSMDLNFDLVRRGFRIERIHIVPDALWPLDKPLPLSAIRQWLENQHERGIIVSLVRESDLHNEHDLVMDFAIYGNRAIGIQELDDHSRTRRFILSFDPQEIQQAHRRWERLRLYAKNYPLSCGSLQKIG